MRELGRTIGLVGTPACTCFYLRPRAFGHPMAKRVWSAKIRSNTPNLSFPPMGGLDWWWCICPKQGFKPNQANELVGGNLTITRDARCCVDRSTIRPASPGPLSRTGLAPNQGRVRAELWCLPFLGNTTAKSRRNPNRLSNGLVLASLAISG